MTLPQKNNPRIQTSKNQWYSIKNRCIISGPPCIGFEVVLLKNAMLSIITEKIVTLHPEPRQGLYAKFQQEKWQFLSFLTTILKALICWKLESFRELRPLGPRQEPYGGPLDPHSYGARANARAVCCAHAQSYANGNFLPPPPLFGNPGSAASITVTIHKSILCFH